MKFTSHREKNIMQLLTVTYASSLAVKKRTYHKRCLIDSAYHTLLAPLT